MPRRSKLVLLPGPLRQQLDARLLARSSSYAATIAWLGTHGIQIKKSALADYAARVRSDAQRMAAAKARWRALVPR